MGMSSSFGSCRMIEIGKRMIIAAAENRTKEEDGRFAPMALTFRRRLTLGIASASTLAIGANFGGFTSFLLSFSPQNSRYFKLDLLYPIQGFTRCLDTSQGFEFIYPANWVGDQRLLYRLAERKESERSLDPPPLTDSSRRQNTSEPVVAFGPPGTSGELNVSVIVSPVPLDFSIEAFGGPKEVGEAVIRTITASSKRPDLKGTLIQSTLREDWPGNVRYYELEFRVDSSSFQRHNVAVCCARRGKLYTLNAQAPESVWPGVKSEIQTIADSFHLTA